MMGLFALEFIEGNTITRLAFRRLQRLSRTGGEAELRGARSNRLAQFTHFLDLPVLLLIVALGVLRPMTWEPILGGIAAAMAVAAGLTVMVPRLLPWRSGTAEHPSPSIANEDLRRGRLPSQTPRRPNL